MTLELVLALTLVAIVAWILIGSTLRRWPGDGIDDPPLEETRRGQALMAIKDLDFDHATGKIGDDDYATLRARYTIDALTALRIAEGGSAETMIAARRAILDGGPVSCPTCGPRPEPGARVCSSCGKPLVVDRPCRSCGAGLRPVSRFCPECGTPGDS